MPLFSFLPFTSGVGHPLSLKILFVLFWQWWEAGNWMERHNMVQNKATFSAQMRVHGICINGLDLSPSSSQSSPFTLSQTLCIVFLCPSSLSSSSMVCTSVPFSVSSSIPTSHSSLSRYPPCSLSFSTSFSRSYTSPHTDPFLRPCVSGLLTELVHVELAGWWHHFLV